MSLKEILWLILKLIPILIFLVLCIGMAFIVYCILCIIMLVIYIVTIKDRIEKCKILRDKSNYKPNLEKVNDFLLKMRKEFWNG